MTPTEDCRRATLALFQAQQILADAPCCHDCDKCNLCIKVWAGQKSCVANLITFATEDILKAAEDKLDAARPAQEAV
ncbi:MAG: hypothetical protein JXA98_08875 [Methanosarcinaceae archaeon]|nr:hypothetical protein [Methanosarcinaceae archaeon]